MTEQATDDIIIDVGPENTATSDWPTGTTVPWADDPIDPIADHPEEHRVTFNEPTPDLYLPRPTQAQINAEAAAGIGARASARAWQRMQTDAYTQQRAQRQFVKEMDMSDPIVQEKIPICRRLNSYRREYKGKINFQFKTDYNPADPRMTLVMLQGWEDQIRMCLNTRGIPTIINGILVIVAGLAERVSEAYDPRINMVGRLKPKIKEAIQRGEFDEEVTQLSIEMADYFALGPKWRLLHKFADKISETYAEVLTPMTVPAPSHATTATGNKVAEVFNKAMDL